MQIRNKIFIPFLQALPCSFRGKNRLARLLLKRAMEECEIPSRSGRIVVPNLAEPVAWDLAMDGCYEPGLCSFIKRHLENGQICLDIGANIGAISRALAEKVGPQGRVYACEPSPRIFTYLKKNTQGYPQIACRETALSSQRGKTIFYQAPESKFGMGTLSALEGWEPTEVSTTTLDGFCQEERIPRIDFIKIDVEGHEAEVFEGAREILSKNREVIVVFEYSDWAENNAYGKSGRSPRVLAELGFDLASLEKEGNLRPLGAELPRTGMWNLVACRDLKKRFFRP